MVAFDEPDAGEEEGDDGEADDVDGYDSDEAGLKGLTVDGDSDDLNTEENEEDGVLNLVDDFPEVVDALVGDMSGWVVLIEATEGDSCGDGLEWSGEVPEVG